MSSATGMGSHQSPSMLKDEWLTPPHILKALDPFDLDPCAPHPSTRPWTTAYTHYWEKGLERDWFGRVWCNPPYGKETGKWLNRLAEHGKGTALIFARTETKMFFSEVWGKATAVLFIEGRLHFHHIDGSKAKANAGAPSVLIAYGFSDAEVLRNCGIAGKYVHLRD